VRRTGLTVGKMEEARSPPSEGQGLGGGTGKRARQGTENDSGLDNGKGKCWKKKKGRGGRIGDAT